MSGYNADIEPRTFGRFMAGGGYAEGVLLELDQDRRIVQTWRGNDYSKNSPDSRLEVHFAADGKGTRVTIIQDDVPEELAAELDNGWREYYQAPMTKYFASGEHKKAAKASAKAGGGKPMKKAAKAKAPAKKTPAKAKTPAKKKAAAKSAKKVSAKKAPAKKATGKKASAKKATKKKSAKKAAPKKAAKKPAPKKKAGKKKRR